MRPGEKLFEELETSDEAIAKTRHPKIFIGKIAGRSSEELAAFLERLRVACEGGAEAPELRALLAGFLPDSELPASRVDEVGETAAGPAVARPRSEPPGALASLAPGRRDP